MVICQGCGQAFSVPEGYTRNKIQCSSCGVICPVPAEARTPASSAPAKSAPARKSRGLEGESPPPGPALEDEAAQWLKDPDPILLHEDTPRFDDPPPRED